MEEQIQEPLKALPKVLKNTWTRLLGEMFSSILFNFYEWRWINNNFLHYCIIFPPALYYKNISTYTYTLWHFWKTCQFNSYFAFRVGDSKKIFCFGFILLWIDKIGYWATYWRNGTLSRNFGMFDFHFVVTVVISRKNLTSLLIQTTLQLQW